MDRAPLLTRGVRVGVYRIDALLGRGGMAAVYLARSPGGAEVALKLLDPPGARAADRDARFAREVASASRLDHPGCVRLLDHGHTPGMGAWLVMERLQGPTLRQALAARHRLAIPEVVQIGRRLCDALDHAHAAGVLHRDVKPENIMYRGPGPTGGVVLIDFGLSRLRDAAPLTAAGTCVGSPTYVAPERLLEHPADGRADLYAVGVVLYELLAGRPPFVGAGPVEIAQQHLSARPPPLSQLRPAVPAPLVAAVHCALEKDPAQRFARPATLAAALDDVPAAADDSRIVELPQEWAIPVSSSDSWA